jgi:hypothetical protein
MAAVLFVAACTKAGETAEKQEQQLKSRNNR